jgi:hypothetical protein
MTATALAAVGSNANESGTLIISGTAVTASGTSVDFTGIPSYAKRITVMFSGVSTNGGSNPIVQLGTSSGVTTSGYLAGSTETTSRAAYTTGFGLISSNAANLIYLQMVIVNVSGNTWLSTHSGNLSQTGIYYTLVGGGNVTLGSTLDRVRITTETGVNTFDAGTLNIFWE